MRIVANGREQQTQRGISLDGFIRSLSLDPRFVIVEYNGEALERTRFADTTLSEGDRIELVRAVAGG